MNSFLKYNLPSFLWAALILWLSLTPGSGLPKIKIPNIDKVVHFAFYLFLALLVFYGWTRQNSFSALHHHRVFKIFFIVFTYGFTIEIIQELFTVNRHFEWLDIAANSTGAAIGSLISVKLFK
ncbi:MAG: VanZ family protein [Bacteroidota bacterium]